MPLIACVSLDFRIFDYAIPESLAGQIQVGHLVQVPLRNKIKEGIVLEIKNDTPKFTLKAIQAIVGDLPLLTKDLLQLAIWMSDYYCTPLPSILPSLLPSAVKKSKHKEQYSVSRAKTREEIKTALFHIRSKSPSQAEILDCMLQIEGSIWLTELLEKTATSRSSVMSLVKVGVLKIEKAKVDRSPLVGEEYFQSKAKILTEEQKAALDSIEGSLSTNQYKTHLIHGVTGSGKTEIYLQAIEKALQLDKGVIMLVPEISLTSQTIETFRSRFEGHIAVLHYRLSAGERHDEWKKIQRGEAKIAIGARSAIFSPVQNLGLIIVDEEHETSYKQTDLQPTYHARDVAVMRGHYSNSTVLLGSATPSLESYHNAKTGKYLLSILKARPKLASMPKVTVVDMKKEYDKKKGWTLFSDLLLSEIERRIGKGEQTILFLNRRGYHTLMLCTACGKSLKCSQCDLSFTFHKNDNALRCHFCHETMQPPPKICSHCQSEDLLKFRGVGTEHVEAALHAIFKEIRTIRLDADTTKHKGSHQQLYRSFRTGKGDILIGTQMLAKGLHFPEVTLVGVLNGDMSLNIPDFRSSETTFQLLTQVAGRAGRGFAEGEVIIQTAIPENSTIIHAANQDYASFFTEEYNTRKLFNFPPFTQLAKVRFTGKDLVKLEEIGATYRAKTASLLPPGYEISRLQPPIHAKIKGLYRTQFFIKGAKIRTIQTALQQVQTLIPSTPYAKIHLDINPVSLL